MQGKITLLSISIILLLLYSLSYLFGTRCTPITIYYGHPSNLSIPKAPLSYYSLYFATGFDEDTVIVSQNGNVIFRNVLSTSVDLLIESATELLELDKEGTSTILEIKVNEDCFKAVLNSEFSHYVIDFIDRKDIIIIEGRRNEPPSSLF